MKSKTRRYFAVRRGILFQNCGQLFLMISEYNGAKSLNLHASHTPGTVGITQTEQEAFCVYGQNRVKFQGQIIINRFSIYLDSLLLGYRDPRSWRCLTDHTARSLTLHYYLQKTSTCPGYSIPALTRSFMHSFIIHPIHIYTEYLLCARRRG